MKNIISTTRTTVILSVLLLVVVFVLFVRPGNLRGTRLYELKIEKSGDGWGYDIYRKNTLFIRQTCIPVIPGNQSFTNRRSARKTGKIVLERLRTNRSPALTREDLYSTGAIPRDSLTNGR